MGGEHGAAALDGGDEARSDAAVAHMAGQGINRGLPLGIMHFLRDAVVGDDPRKVLRQRHEDEHAAAVLGIGNPAHDELLERGAVCLRALQWTWHERHAQRQPREYQACGNKDRKLPQIDLLHAPVREIDERPRRDQRQYSRP